MAPTFENPKVVVTAIYDYYSGVPEDLSFKTDDEIEIVKYENEDWAMGRLNNKTGLLPLNFVKHNN